MAFPLGENARNPINPVRCHARAKDLPNTSTPPRMADSISIHHSIRR